MMEMLLLDVKNNQTKVVECNGLNDYYNFIGCKYVDIVRRVIGGVPVNIVCDDCGLFEATPKVSAINCTGQPCLFGNLLIASGRVTPDGELTPLTEYELRRILASSTFVTTKYHTEPYRVLVRVAY